MTTLSHSESRRKYSWWWDSHNTPKNSKWLQENITDMDGKVKTMIKLIEEDADSFARRAEMYYKKRPELMKLVEEFYRAYRALAERYNHATGELRYAHRTIAAAFPDQVPFELIEDSPTEKDGEPDAVLELIGNAHALSESDLHAINRTSPREEDSEGGMRKRGLKQLQEMFGGPKNEKDREGGELLQLSNENQNLKVKCRNETERAGKAAREVEGLKKALADMEAEKEKVVMKYKQCLAKLSEIEGELSNAQMDSMRLDEKASRAEIEVHTLKEALVQFEVEKIAGMIKHEECLGKISHLEAMASQFLKDKNALDGRAVEAENQAEALKDEITRLELEKETVVCQYKHCLEKISELEKIVSISEDDARMAKNRAERAEYEVSELKKAVANLYKEKEASALQYKYCLETISELEKDLASARDDVKRLKNEVMVGSAKLKDVKEKSSLLEMSNQALRVEADDLAKKIEMKDLELSDKQEELEKLQSCLQDENSRRAQVEGALRALQNLHTQSEDDHRALAEELKNTFQMLKEMEVSKNGLEEEIRQVRDENLSLSESTSCSAASVENMQTEIFSLREIRERLEKEVSYHNGVSVSLEQEISCLKKEIEGLNRSYEALVEQVEAAGLDPKCVRTSIKSLQDEKLRLEELCEEGKNEKTILSKKLASIEGVLKKKAEVEGSLSDLNDELAMSREKVNALQESCQYLSGGKATLVSEKASLLSQLQAMTENMNSLVRQNAVIENSLSMAKVELEGLREKSKGLEEICDLLKNERSYLLAERDTLVRKLENVERRLENLEKKFTGLEEKYGDLEKENEAMQCQVEKLTVLLGDEKQERIGFQLVSETRMVGLENEIHILQEENRWKKKESEEEHDKAVKAQFEISILQRFMKEMEEKNCSLIIECQKHVEASKMAEKVISELESEGLEQQVEAELLLDEIERLRLGIYQIFRALDTGLSLPEEKLEDERVLVDLVMESVESMKCSMSRNEDEKQKLVFENSVFLALLEQLETKGVEIELQKIQLEKEAGIMAEKNAMVKNEKDKLVEINEQLKSDVDEGRQAAAVLQAELGSLCVKQDDLQEAYNVLQKAFSRVNQENSCLLKKLSDVIEEKWQVDQFNDAVVMELLATTNQSAALESFATEKIVELKSLLEDLNRQYQINSSLDKEMAELGRKLDLQEAENLVLKDTVCRLEKKMQEIKESNVQIKQDIVNGKESLIRTEAKLFETEKKLETVENLNSSLCRTMEEFKIDMDRSMKIREDLEKNVAHLSETNSEQKNEIESLHSVNKDLESELGFLRQEIEENMVREQTLSTELQGMTDEFELWENEASTFCFDLQVSSINEVLLKNKVQELTGVCRNLKDEHAGKMSEIDQMKEQIRSMENEISGLKSQLSAYGPIVASLRDDITLIERNALLRMKLKAADDQDTEFFEIDSHSIRDTSLIPREDESLVSLQNLQMRVKVVGKLMEETNMAVSQRRSVSNTKQEPTVGENDRMKESSILRRQRSKKKGRVDELNDSPKLLKIKNKASEARNGMLMKDIPLDQVSNSSMRKKKGNNGSDDLMLELWEAADDDKGGRAIAESLKISYRLKQKSELPLTDSDIEREFGVDKLELSTRTIADPSQEENDEKILERLAFDADKLVCLQTTVANLRWILETDKKGRKGKNVDFDTVEEQLQEAEDTIVHLFDLNGQLVKNIEDCPHDETLSPRMKETVKTWRTKVMEQAEKGSERIESLQLSVQKILFVLSKMEDECKNKGRNKFMRNRTVILRDFIQYGKKNSGRRKKGPRCGCFRQATTTGNEK